MGNLYDRIYDDFVWGFKYRPKSLDDMILPTHLIARFDSVISKGGIGNILLHGDQGLGKTTIAMIISDTLDRDALYINGTMEGGIDTIRTKLDSYCSTVGWDNTQKKLVILDEFDGLSDKAEKSLKVFIEQYGAVCDFIFITNHVMEISDKLKSRLQEISFDISKDDQRKLMPAVATKLKNVLDEENVKYDIPGITMLVKELMPDIRKVFNEAQNLSGFGGITEDIIKANVNFDSNKYLDLIKNKNYQEIQKLVINLSITPARFFNRIFEDIFEKVVPEARAEFILLLSDYLQRSEKSTQPQIHICAFSLSIMTTIKFS